MTEPRPVVVTGGSGSIAANLPELMALAEAFGRAGAALHDTRDELRHTLDGPLAGGRGPLAGSDLATSLRLSDVRVVVAAALADLFAAVLLCAAVRAGLRRAVTLYVLGEGSLARSLARLGRSVTTGQVTLVVTGSPDRAAQATLTADPRGWYGLAHLTPLGIAQEVLQHRARDGTGVAVPTGVDHTGVAGRPPRDLEDLIGDLAQRNDDPRHGEIDVRVLTLPDGSRKVVVDITGTKSWGFTAHDVTDLRTNLAAMNGHLSAYEQGVVDALRRSGVRADDDVMLVGHSQGGMIAVNTAARLARSGEFRVTHVVTAGSPVGRGVRAVPGRTQVLSLENRDDVVPVLDDTANPDRPSVTTVTTDRGDGTVGGDHGLRSGYLPAARDVEASGQRSVRHVLGTMRGYFGATSVTTHTYQVRRT